MPRTVSTIFTLCIILFVGCSLADEMSPAFQKQGQRALDAIERIPLFPSANKIQPGFEQRMLDAEKAIDEAKYNAKTNKDKEVLKILQTTIALIKAQKSMEGLDPDRRITGLAEIQCEAEIKALFEPDSLSTYGIKQAAEKTCLKKVEAINKIQEQRRLQ